MDLLDELWSLIFREYLDFLDTIRCRRVSKRFKFLIDALRPTELLVYGYYTSSLEYTYTDDRDPEMWIQLRSFDFEPNSSFQIVFASLKFLQLDSNLKESFNLELLNEFTCLEKLYANTVVISRSQTLRLPRLKVLSLKLFSTKEYNECPYRWENRIDYNREPRLVIDCKVKTLIGYRPILLVLKHPECIEYLEAIQLNVSFQYPKLTLEQLIPFQNVRILCVLLTEGVLEAFHLFKNLQELHLDKHFNGRNFETKKQLMEQLLIKRSELKINAKIYYTDVLVNLNQPEELIFYSSLGSKIANFHKLADCLKQVHRVEYSNLISLRADLTRNQIALERGFPVDFFGKFPNIKFVFLTRIDDTERLAWFFSKCTRLTRLGFSRGCLSQPILNLFSVIKHLKELEIIYHRDKNQARLDLSPVYELRQLFSLEIDSDDANPDSSFDLGTLLEKCRYLTDIRLQHITIWKSDLYTVYIHRSRNDSPTASNRRGTYAYDELKSILNVIIQECRDFQKKFNWSMLADQN